MFCQNCGNQLEAGVLTCSKCGASTNPTAVPEGSAMSLPSRWRRLGTYIIDYIIIYIIALLIGFIIGLVIGVGRGNVEGNFDAIGKFIGLVVILVYFIVCESVWQRTVGKFILGTKVVMKDGSKPPMKNIVGRSFARIIPFEPLSVLVRSIGWHDSLSGTLVVPASYTPEQVAQINTNNIKNKWGLLALVLLLIVIPIMVSIVLLALNGARSKARDAMRVSHVRQISTSVELYRDQNGTYPTTLAQLTPKYLKTPLVAPTPHDGTCTEEQNDYHYALNSPEFYEIGFCLGAATGEYQAGVNRITNDTLVAPFEE